MNHFIQHHLDNLLALINNHLNKSLNKIAEYFNEQGGLVEVAQSWGGVAGRFIGKALALTLIWTGILLSLVVLLVANLVVFVYQVIQPVVFEVIDNYMLDIDLKTLYQIGENLKKNK